MILILLILQNITNMYYFTTTITSKWNIQDTKLPSLHNNMLLKRSTMTRVSNIVDCYFLSSVNGIGSVEPNSTPYPKSYASFCYPLLYNLHLSNVIYKILLLTNHQFSTPWYNLLVKGTAPSLLKCTLELSSIIYS